MKERIEVSPSKYVKLHRVSKHFDYFFDEQFKEKEQAFEDIKNTLEAWYDKLKDFFEIEQEEFFSVFIYSDMKSHHEESYGGDAPYWATAGGSREGISTIDPTIKNEYKTYDRMIKDLPHELVHSFTFRDIPCNVPVEDGYLTNWFSEGLAVYLTEPEVGKERIISEIKEKGLPPLSKFDRVTIYDFGMNYGYQFSISLIEVIIKLFGKKKIIEIRNRFKEDIYEVLGISRDELEKKWHEFLKEKYKGELG